ncbi:MAG: DUF6588 family protein [Bacteroidota bacterium]
MKRNNFRKGLFMLMMQSVLMASVYSQNLLLDVVQGGVDDAEVILQDYLEPFAHIVGSDLNAGWYNTARPHKLGGLDVTATVSWAKAPVSALTYDISDLELNGELEPSYGSIAPTIAGEQEIRPELSYSQSVDLGGGNFQDVEYARITVPDGSGVDLFPLPMAQLTVGLPFGTDVSARFVPLVGYKDYGKIGLWGVGGKHSLTQWIPGFEKLDFLDVSVQGGYTKVASSVHVRVEPLPTDIDPYPDYNWDDQFIIQKVEGWTLNLIASQTLSVITFYQGIGYASSLVELLLEGHYPVNSVITDMESPDLGRTIYEIMENPISTKYENYNNLRLNVGARIKLGVFTLHYDFTYTLYATQSVGIGISFR